MSDLISRQAAISHVDDVPYIKEHPNVGLLWKAWIESLPSAQPEQIARDIATIIENEKDMRVILQNTEHTETHSCDCERTETHDLVCRRAALEAMDTLDKFGCDPDGKLVRYDDDKHYVPYVNYEDMVHAVKNLPSAEPERKWIPVSEALPKVRTDVLLAFEKNMAVGFYSHDCWNVNTGNGFYIGVFTDEDKPIAWKPLPEPWRGE